MPGRKMTGIGSKADPTAVSVCLRTLNSAHISVEVSVKNHRNRSELQRGLAADPFTKNPVQPMGELSPPISVAEVTVSTENYRMFAGGHRSSTPMAAFDWQGMTSY